MSTVTLSIGRNIGADPMPAEDWTTFRAYLNLAAVECGLDVVFTGTGAGIWQGEISEDAHTVVGLTTDATDLEELARSLGQLARAYRQDAIAMTVGETTLVTPRD